jgi:hypothetical protein
MADKEVGDLTAASALSGSEIIHLVQSGNSRQEDLDTIKAFMAPNASYVMLNATASSHTSNTNKVFSWGTEVADTDAYHDAGNPTRIVFPFTGLYRLHLRTRWAAVSAAFLFQQWLSSNNAGSTTFSNDFPDFFMEGQYDSANVARQIQISGLISGVATEYFEVVAYQFGATRNQNADSSLHMEFIE